MKKVVSVGTLLLVVLAQAETRPVIKSGTSFELTPRESKMLVRLAIGGQIRSLILDTGTPGVVVDSSVVGMRPEQLKGARVVVGENSVPSEVSSVSFDFGGVEFHAKALVVDLASISRRVGMRVDGIIGMSVLQSFKRILVDFENGSLTLER